MGNSSAVRRSRPSGDLGRKGSVVCKDLSNSLAKSILNLTLPSGVLNVEPTRWRTLPTVVAEAPGFVPSPVFKDRNGSQPLANKELHLSRAHTWTPPPVHWSTETPAPGRGADWR